MSTTSQLSERTPARSAGAARKVNFFIVGAPKCGTTAWFEYLRSHPDIFIPEIKEPCFFCSDFPSISLAATAGEYAEMFEEAGEAAVIGEASSVYLSSTAAARAIARYNSKAKILILLREQEDYLPSLHNEHLRLFWDEIEDFERAWRLSGMRTQADVPEACPEPAMLDYVAMGRFSEQVQRYLDVFPREQVRILHFREWTSDPRATYLQILQFLGLEDDGRRDFRPVNEGVSYRSRTIARMLSFPPPPLRRVATLVKRLTGIQPATLGRAAGRAKDLLVAPGYAQKISPALRDEIRGYYAADNRRLEALLSREQ